MFSLKASTPTGLRIQAGLKAKNLTVEDLLSDIALKWVEEGVIPPGIPGFSVEVVSTDKLKIIMEEYELGPLTWLAAEAFGALLRAAAEMVPPTTYLRPALANEPRAFRTGPHGEAMVALGDGQGVAVLSIGRAVAIKCASATSRRDASLRSLPRGIAKEFGTMVQQAAEDLRRVLNAVWDEPAEGAAA